MIKRVGNVVMIQLSGTDSNIYLLGDTAIDAGTGLNFTRLRDFLKIAKVSLGDIKQVVNTHCHYDHVGGNGYFINAKVLAHEHDAEVIEKGDAELAVVEFFDGFLKPRKVDQRLKHGDIVSTAQSALEVIHAPGHTAGSICLFDRKNGLLFTGDTVFSTTIGRVDFPNSDPEEMAKTLEMLGKLPVKQVFPGHGEPFDAATFKKVVKTSVAEFEKRMEEGEVDDDYI